ncbi:hypothetical protein D9M69_404570 [compost metagenome]
MATAEGAEHREGAQLAIALYDGRPLDHVLKILEYTGSVEAAARMSQFKNLWPLLDAGNSAVLTSRQGRAPNVLHVTLVLMNHAELDKALTGIQWHASEGGVKYRGSRAAGL